MAYGPVNVPGESSSVAADILMPDGTPLDEAIEKIEQGKADIDPETGKIKEEQLPEMDYAPSDHTHSANDLPIIPITKGGTGATTAAKALAALIGGATELTSLDSADLLGLMDESANTGKKITLSNLLSWIKSNGSLQIQSGSYTGTGKFGSANPNTLTFDFVPKIVFASKVASPHLYGSYGFTWFGQSGTTSTSNDAAPVSFSFSGKTLSWYGDKANTQLNESGTGYIYTAIA